MKICFLSLLTGCAALVLGLILIEAYGVIEQHCYISKVAPILIEINNPTDPKLDSLRKIDDLGFVVNINAVQLNDGWVVIADRFYPALEDPPTLREFVEHRIILFKDSNGRVYAQTQGMFPTDDINNKGENDFGAKVDKTTDAFKDSIEKSAKPRWSFLEIHQ